MTALQRVTARLQSVTMPWRVASALVGLVLWPLVPALLWVAATAVRPSASDEWFWGLLWVWYGAFALYVAGIGYALATWFPRHPWIAGIGWWLASFLCLTLGARAVEAWPAGLGSVQYLAAPPGHGQDLPNFILEPYITVGWLPLLLGVGLACWQASRVTRN